MMRPYFYGAALAAIVFALVLAYMAGQGDNQEKIDQQNKDAQNAAIEAAQSRRDCVAAGGVWRFEASKCSRP